MSLPPGFKFYRALIESTASKYQVDPLVLAALVWQESDFNTDAFRHEPDFWNRYLKGNPKYKGLNPRRVSSSYGLAQVMYCRILEDKVADNDAWAPELLFIPENGLDIGCGFFAELLAWAKTPAVTKVNVDPVFVALAAYNGGRGGNDPNKNWPLKCGTYARDVLAKRAVLEKEYALDRR